MPPTGSTRPDSVISPVIAMSPRTGRPVSSDASAVDHRDAGRRAVLRDGAGRHVEVDLGRPCRTSDRRRSCWRARGTTRARSAPTPSSRRRGGRSASGVPPPCIREASTNSTSPPAGVHARPMATPGSFVRFSISSSRNVGAPSISTTTSGVIDDARLVAFGAAPRDLAAERADLALEIADAGLARVAADDRRDRRVGELDLLRRQPVVRDLLGDRGARRRSSASLPRCSRRARAPPCGRAAAAGSDRARSRS